MIRNEIMKTQGMNKVFQLTLGLFLMAISAIAVQAQSSRYKITESYLNNGGKINYIVPDASWANTSNEGLPTILQSIYGLNHKPELSLMKESTDDRFHIQRFDQMYGQAYVYGGDIIVKRDKSGKILAIVGTMRNVEHLSNTPVMSPDTAVERGIDQIGRDRPFMWLSEQEEEDLKWFEEDSTATYFPSAKLVYYPRQIEPFADYVLCYEMEIYTFEPARYITFINASTGKMEYHYNGNCTCQRRGYNVVQRTSKFHIREAGHSLLSARFNSENLHFPWRGYDGCYL